jgi:uncharacterized membrane protein YdbT with pleckstrin-like domain
MDLHPGEEVIFEGHPSWRATLGFYIQGLMAVAVAAGIAALVTAIGDGLDWGIVAIVAVAGVVLVVLAGFLKRLATVYTITNQRLRIKRGIIARKVQQTRIDRVQNVNTDQSVLERILRVGTVDFDTAGTEDSDFTFEGVARLEQIVSAVERAQHEAATAPAEPAPDEPARDPDPGP